MKEPNPRSSRLALTGGLIAVIILGGAGFLLGRNSVERPDAAIVPALSKPTAVSSAPTDAGTTQTVMGRAGLIKIAAEGADALASGREPGKDVTDAAGRRFEIRLPFGCNGPAGEASNAAMRWRYDKDAEALRLHVAPVAWRAEEWWRNGAPASIEAIEGFWVARPWTSSEACPLSRAEPATTGAEPITLPGQTLAIGQIFADGDARAARRDGKPYQSVLRVPESELEASQGFLVRLKGRLAGEPRGPVRCQQSAGPEQRPICLVAVELDEISIENGATQETLATWNVAPRRATGL